MFDQEKAQEDREARNYKLTVAENIRAAVNDDMNGIITALENSILEFNRVIELSKQNHISDSGCKIYASTINMRDVATQLVNAARTHATAIDMVRNGAK